MKNWNEIKRNNFKRSCPAPIRAAVDPAFSVHQNVPCICKTPSVSASCFAMFTITWSCPAAYHVPPKDPVLKPVGRGGGIKPTWVEPSLAQPAVGSSLAGSKLQSGLAYTMVVLIVGSHSLLGSSLVVTPSPAASSTRPANMSAGGLALTHQGLFRHTRY